MKTAINLNLLEGAWESVNLHPAVMIYRHYNGRYHLLIIPMNEHTCQAQPSTYEIEVDETGYFVGRLFDRQQLSYDAVMDTICLSRLGEYMRN